MPSIVQQNRAVSLWNDDTEVRDIARMVGLTERQVYNAVHRARLSGHDVASRRRGPKKGAVYGQRTPAYA